MAALKRAGEAKGRLRHSGEARVIGEIVPLLTSPEGWKAKLREIAERLSREAGYDAVEFIVTEPENPDQLAHYSFSEVPESLHDAWTEIVTRREDFSAFALLEKSPKPIISPHVQSDPRATSFERSIARRAGIGSALVVPLAWQGNLIGALCVSKRQENGFDHRDADFLLALANEVSAIVRQDQLIHDLERSATRLVEMRNDSVMMLASAAEAYDAETGLHLLHVRDTTELLALELDFDASMATQIAEASVLHDIGKMRVPRRLLRKHGPLSNAEQAIMRKHTIWGEEFLSGRAGFELAARVARWHHERWDGKGYPDGLEAQQIPLSVAVVSVADCLDAIVTWRPYSEGHALEWAVEEIAGEKARQFHPKVAQALVRLHKRGALPQMQIEAKVAA